MKAFLLAAGLGKRLRPLTLQQPKPLIEVGGCSLVEHHLLKLKLAGICEVVINTHWLAEELRQRLGDGSSYGVDIHWSHEPELLETGGGIYKARDMLGEAPFLLASADIYSELDYRQLLQTSVPPEGAHLVLVPNPEHNPGGDFELQAGQVRRKGVGGACATYSGIAMVSGAWVQQWQPATDAFPLVDPFWQAADAGQLTGQLYEGCWTDVGTPQRLHSLRAKLAASCS